MKTLLGVLMVFIVSGDNETINGTLEESVLLPCNCSMRNLNKELRWQVEKAHMTLVFKHNENSSNFYGTYKGRGTTFLSENSNNCSFLLTNITADDQGRYICIFHVQDTYQQSHVNLSVSAKYNVCQHENLSGSGKVFKCYVKGRYREAEIQWNLNGELLHNSTTTYITHTHHVLDAASGFYHFNSTLSTKLNWTSKPTCNVKAKGISTSSDCSPEFYKLVRETLNLRFRYLTIIPIMLVLGFFLLLSCSNFSRSSRRTGEVETMI
ncbi:butyrophilin subfamily 3 member A2-like [Plectropomus leopardus]|uniref:butyrophilin subfamily 3 member A2-like n=1 Tax=Plectropomus leopardus TaxID=160734 RepID=UPI001C4DBF37|nr:butyrophilin subfamily 3 member A2-like [Plectropomus leopardus]